QGGRLEAFYFTFGEADAIGIAELPDNVTAAALSLAINASGVVGVKTTVLLTTDEMDQATKNQIGYRPPGHRGVDTMRLIEIGKVNRMYEEVVRAQDPDRLVSLYTGTG